MGGRGGAGRSSGGNGGDSGPLAEVFAFPARPAPPTSQGTPGQVIPISGNVDSAIMRAFNSLKQPGNDYVSLAGLRDRLGGFTRSDVDSALRKLATSGRLGLIPEENQKTLTTRDRKAALRLGGEDNHLVFLR